MEYIANGLTLKHDDFGAIPNSTFAAVFAP